MKSACAAEKHIDTQNDKTQTYQNYIYTVTYIHEMDKTHE